MLGGDPNAGREPISQEELRGLVAAHESLSTDERRLIDDVFAAGERSISEVMVPRPDVVFLEGAMTVSKAIKLAADSPHERYPVIGRDQDDVLGFVHIRDLILGDPRVRPRTDRRRAGPRGQGHARARSGCSWRCRRCAARATTWRSSSTSTAAPTASSPSRTWSRRSSATSATRAACPAQDEPRRFSGGVVELDGKENLDEVAEVSGLELPEGPYATLGGYVMAELGRLPQEHDRVSHDGFLLDVIEVDGRRVARVRVTPPAPESDEPADARIDDRG